MPISQDQHKTPAELINDDHRCRHCHYNLRSLTVPGRCPECGTDIDLTRHPPTRSFSAVFGLVASFLATSIVILLIGFMVLVDSLLGKSGEPRLQVIVFSIGALVAIPTWRISKRKAPCRAFVVLVAVLVILPRISIMPGRPFMSFFKSVRNGITQTEVLAVFDDYFPDRSANGSPVYRDRLPKQLTFYNRRFDGDTINVYFVDGEVGSKRYMID
jgi:hypothetical protein